MWVLPESTLDSVYIEVLIYHDKEKGSFVFPLKASLEVIEKNLSRHKDKRFEFSEFWRQLVIEQRADERFNFLFHMWRMNKLSLPYSFELNEDQAVSNIIYILDAWTDNCRSGGFQVCSIVGSGDALVRIGLMEKGKKFPTKLISNLNKVYFTEILCSDIKSIRCMQNSFDIRLRNGLVIKVDEKSVKYDFSEYMQIESRIAKLLSLPLHGVQTI